MSMIASAPAEVLIDYIAGGKDAGYSKSPLYQAKSLGLFVEPIKVGRRAFMTNRERDALVRAHISHKSDDEIRALVAKLHAQRQEAA